MVSPSKFQKGLDRRRQVTNFRKTQDFKILKRRVFTGSTDMANYKISYRVEYATPKSR